MKFRSFGKMGYQLLLLVSAAGWLLAGCNETPLPVAKTETASTPFASATPGLRATQPQPATPSPKPTSRPTSSLKVQAADLRNVRVALWHPWSGETGALVQDLVRKFNLENEWGILAQSTYQGNLDGLNDQVQAALKSGSLPNIVVGTSYQAQSWNANGKLVDLGSLVDDPVWGLTSQEQADFYPVFWEQDDAAGKRWGVPAQSSGQLLFYNLTWANALGFDKPPLTPVEFRQQACAASKANLQDDDPDNDHTGGWIVSNEYSALLGWIYAFGGEMVAPSGKGYQFDTKAVRDAFTFLRSLYDQGCAWLTESQAPDSDFAARRGLFAAGSVTDLPYQDQAFRQAGNSDRWTVIAFPSPAREPAIDVYGTSFEMFTSPPAEQLASWLFIKWLLTPENQARLAAASSAFPPGASALDSMQAYAGSHPQWSAAAALLPEAHGEPALESWGTVRWALFDAGTQLFRYYFTVDQVSNLTKLLGETAAELNAPRP